MVCFQSLTIFGQHFANPSAPDRIPHALSTAVLEVGAHAQGKELPDDLSLRAYCRCRTGSTTPGVLHGEVKRCGPRHIFERRVAASPEKTSHRGSAPRSDGAAQRCRTV